MPSNNRRVAHISQSHPRRVPHLHDGLIVATLGSFRGSENPNTLNLAHLLRTALNESLISFLAV
jgi:hypothetical protein